MALPTNDDFANRALSIEELEAIAAAGDLELNQERGKLGLALV